MCVLHVYMYMCYTFATYQIHNTGYFWRVYGVVGYYLNFV